MAVESYHLFLTKLELVVLVFKYLTLPVVHVVLWVSHKKSGQLLPLHVINQPHNKGIMTAMTGLKRDELIILSKNLQMIPYALLVTQQDKTIPDQPPIWSDLPWANPIVL